MIDQFLDSWPLFQNAYLSGWLVGLLLSVLGVYAVARDQIFLGAAAAQASTLGIALALWSGAASAGAGLLGEWTPSLFAAIFSAGAALLTSRESGEGRDSREALTGWVFLTASSASLLLLSKAPHGLEEVRCMLSSSMLGARESEVKVYGILAAAALLTAGLARDRLALLAMDPAMAAACGIRARAWGRGLAIALGVAIGLAIRSTGVLYTFGCLVLPTLAARGCCGATRPLFFLAPLAFLLCALPGFVLAHAGDFPPAQMTIALLCVAVAIGRFLRAAMRGRQLVPHPKSPSTENKTPKLK